MKMDKQKIIGLSQKIKQCEAIKIKNSRINGRLKQTLDFINSKNEPVTSSELRDYFGLKNTDSCSTYLRILTMQGLIRRVSHKNKVTWSKL